MSEGKMELNEAFNLGDMDARIRARSVQKISDELEKSLAPAGALNLPPLLEARRVAYGISNGAFRQQATFDRVLAFQISQYEGETFGNSSIIMTDVGKKREQESAPRAIVVSAGLRALDDLRSNGMDVGHIVSFVRFSPWRMRVDTIAGMQFFLLVLHSGDIIASEDTAAALRAGELRMKTLNRTDGAIEHFYVGPDDRAIRPTTADTASEGY